MIQDINIFLFPEYDRDQNNKIKISKTTGYPIFEPINRYIGCMYFDNRDTILLNRNADEIFEPITIFRKLPYGESMLLISNDDENNRIFLEGLSKNYLIASDDEPDKPNKYAKNWGASFDKWKSIIDSSDKETRPTKIPNKGVCYRTDPFKIHSENGLNTLCSSFKGEHGENRYKCNIAEECTGQIEAHAPSPKLILGESEEEPVIFMTELDKDMPLSVFELVHNRNPIKFILGKKYTIKTGQSGCNIYKFGKKLEDENKLVGFLFTEEQTPDKIVNVQWKKGYNPFTDLPKDTLNSGDYYDSDESEPKSIEVSD